MRPFLVSLLAIAACSDSQTMTSDASPDASLPDVMDAPTPPELTRFCGNKNFQKSRNSATAGKLTGTYKGAYDGPGANKMWRAGDLETIRVVPAHPFIAKKIRVAFARGSGSARLHVVHTFGRSYPGNFPSAPPKTLPDYIDPPDLFEPVDVDVMDAKPDNFIEVPIPETILLPTQHYMIVFEHLDATLKLAIEDVPPTDIGRSQFFNPPTRDMYGVAIDKDGTPGNYRMELLGDEACAWSDQERWFGAQTNAPFASNQTGYIALADIDGDGHDDAISTEGAHAYKGDGKGGFTAFAFDPFVDAPKANSFVFADLDNDGDQDVFASAYVQTDSDADGYRVDVDCNDADPAIHPGAMETTNSIDDDCDKKADDGTSTADADGDGKTIAQGDCDDTRKTVFPGAPELLDSLDNDCNGKTDETFTSKILKNDGTGHFTKVTNPDVEIVTSSTVVALGDGNNDGILDAYAGSWLIHYPDFPTEPSRYYEGQGACLFKDALTKAGLVMQENRPVYGLSWLDFDNDGLLDLYVSTYNLRDDVLWKNMGGTFVDVAPQVHVDHDDIPSGMSQYPGGHSYPSDPGDFDNDGDIDIFVPQLSHPRTQPWADPSALFVNQGKPTFDFKNERRQRGIIYDEGDVNSTWADFDNDMDLDLIVIPTYPGHYSKLYRNDGDHFTDITYESNAWIHMSQLAVWGDIDEDGDLDLIVTGVPPSPRATVFLNRVGTQNHWVQFKLQGTTANKDAIGARVSVTAGGVTQIRELGATSDHQGSKIVQIGLGKNTSIDSLSVHWPGGMTETITGATIDKRWKIVQGSGKATP